MSTVIELILKENQTQALATLQKQLAKELEQNFLAHIKTVGDLKAVLTEVLQAQPGFATVAQTAQRQVTNLTLVHPSVEIRNLPWQLAIEHLPLLYLSKSHMAQLPAAPPQYGFPLKILVMVSTPEGAKGLDFEQEEAQLLKAFHPLMQDGLVQVHFTDDGSLEDLDRRLQDNYYHILHFSGHGVYENGIGYLILEDQVTGHIRKVSAQDFNTVLAKAADLNHRPELVVLSACQTAQAKISGETGGVADALLHGGQSAVVAMSASILDNCATQFAAAFYCHLAEGLPLTKAFKEASNDLRHFETQYQNILLSHHSNSVPAQWLIPQLLLGKDLLFIGDHEKPAANINFKVDIQFVTGEKDLLKLRVRPKNYVFIGRRRDKRTVFHLLLEGKAVLLRGQGGVGKTAFAEHLGIRLIAFSQKYKPFVLSNVKVQDFKNDFKTSEKEAGDLPLISEMRHYLTGLNQFNVLGYNEQKTIEEKLSFLLKSIEKYCVPIFIFDNIESYQDLQTGDFNKDEYEHIFNILDYVIKHSKSPVIITGRYPVKELPEIFIYDLNTVTLTDFWKKCQQLHLRELMDSADANPRNGVVKVEVSLSFMQVVHRLHQAFGGNYRALEFFDELYTQRGRSAMFFTLENLEKLEDSLQDSTAEVRQRMSIDLVFNQLLLLLSPVELDALQVLTHFNIPILPKAIEMQRNGDSFKVVLNRLADLTLVERNQLNDNVWFYVMPIVKDLIKDISLSKVVFSERLAGDYHVFIEENINTFDKKDLIEAFNCYKNAYYTEGVNRIGTALSTNYYFLQQFRQSLIYGSKTYEICQDKTNSEVWTCLGLIYKLYGELDKSLAFYEMALSKIRKENNLQEEGIVLNNLGQIYDEKGDYEKAIQYLEQGLSIAKELKDDINESTCLTNLGKVVIAQLNYNKALGYFQASLTISRQHDNLIGQGVNLNNIGRILTDIGELDEALVHLEEGLTIQKKIGDYQGIGITLNNISLIYIHKGDYNKAIQYLEQSLNTQQQTGDQKAEGASLNNIGRVYSANQDYATALKYFEKSLEIRTQIQDFHGRSISLNNIAQIYASLGDYENALSYFEEGLALQEEMNDINGMCPILHNLSNIYLTQKKDIEKWFEYANRAYQLALEMENAEWIYRVGQDFGFFLCEIGDKKQGVPILKKAIETGRKAGFNDVKQVEAAVQHLLY